VINLKDIFVVHPSVFHDAFRTDYTTQYRDSSKEFLNLLRNHKIKNNEKIGFISGEIFKSLHESKLGSTKTIWIIPEYLVEVDFETLFNQEIKLDIEQSLIRLASKKCIGDIPFIVSTRANLNLEGTNFHIFTPAKAVDYYRHPNSLFQNRVVK